MLTQRRQRQAIRDVMAGLTPALPYEQLQEPYDYLWEIVQDCSNAQQAYETLIRVGFQDGELKPDVDAILALEPGYRAKYPSLAEVGPELPETTWLWESWIPRGMLSLLAAWPGIGKTYLALDLARSIIAGQPAPDETPFQIRTGTIIFVDAEDFLPQIYKRVKSWRMDMSKFYPVRRPPRELIDMSRPEYQDDLIDMCSDIQPDLVIVDSLSSVNIRGENNIEDLRDILSFFVELAQNFDCGLVINHHLRKPGQGQFQALTMHDLRGSGHLVAMARSILGMELLKTSGVDDPNGPRLFKVLKTNLGKYPKPLSVEFEECTGNAGIAVLSYSPIELSAIHTTTQTEACTRWLLALLKEHGPLTYSEIIDYAADEGFSRRVIGDVRHRLGDKVVDTLGPKRKGNRWTLLDSDIDPAMTPVASATTLTGQCAEWLLEMLRDNPHSYMELKTLAADHGYSENVLQEARRKLGPRIIDTHGPKRPGNRWQLAEWVLTDEEQAFT
jgi:hypothetical protein